MPINAAIEGGHTWVVGDTIDAATLNKMMDLALAQVPTPILVKDGGTGGVSAAEALDRLSAVGYLTAWVEFGNDGTPVSMGTLPAYAFVLDTQIHTTVAFDGTGADEGIIGTGADDDLFGVATEIGAIGKVYPAHGVGVGYVASAVEVFAEYNDANSDAAAGKACFVLTYAIVAVSP